MVQKYIEKPLLYKNRKFDIRILGLIDNEKNFYLYKPCYLRTSSDDYTLQNHSKYIHLTNNCFQMNSSNYERHEEGNQIPYYAFVDFLKEHYQSKFPDFQLDHIMQRMKDIMIDCHMAAVNQLDPKKRSWKKMEVVGFDFLIDEDIRVWLLEVNTCPFMGPVLTSCEESFMTDLVNDTFKLTIDKWFFDRNPTREEIENETMYELLCSHDGSYNKRSQLGLAPKTEQTSESKAVDKFNQTFHPDFYPSKMMH